MSLTDEQIRKIESTCWSRPGFGARFDRWKFARAIEAPLLERIAELERELATERSVSFRDQVAQLEQELEAVRKDAEWLRGYERQTDAAKEQP